MQQTAASKYAPFLFAPGLLCLFAIEHLSMFYSFLSFCSDMLRCRYTNTSAVISRISYIDGEKGVLRYRGFPIEELADKSTHLEVRK